jgi:hypothetical protein
VVVSPLHTLRNDATVGYGVAQVSRHLVHLVGRAVQQLVKGGAVANHDLTRVLVRHHDGGHRQLGALGSWVVRVQRLLAHADVVVLALLVGRTATK